MERNEGRGRTSEKMVVMRGRTRQRGGRGGVVVFVNKAARDEREREREGQVLRPRPLLFMLDFPAS